jgi:hypothetical protein
MFSHRDRQGQNTPRPTALLAGPGGVVKIRMLIYTPTSRGGSVLERWSGSLTGRCKQWERALYRQQCATTAQRGGCHVDADSKQPCCTRDEGGPLGLGVQARGPNHRMLLRPKDRGGERDGKGGINPSGERWEDERE